MICTNATVFVGNAGSTFSATIMNWRLTQQKSSSIYWGEKLRFQ